MIKKYSLKILIFLMLAALSLPGVLHAKFEPALTDFNVNTGLDPQPGPNEDVQVTVRKTQDDTSGYTIQGYIYTWNDSKAELGIDGLYYDEEQFGWREYQGSDTVIVTDKNQFANSDRDTWYLHVKTVFFSDTQGTDLSQDVVSPAITFDNVAPTGVISLDTTVSGQETGKTASGTKVIFQVNASEDTRKIYLNETPKFPSDGSHYKVTSGTPTLEYNFKDSGEKTIYAWFEDAVGNKTVGSVSFTFTILGGKLMDPANDLNLDVGATQEFQILGAGDEDYTWSIVDADNTAVPSSAATVVGDGNKATVTGASEGSVKVKAVTEGEDPFYSGIITVEESVMTGDVNNDGVVDSGDAILVLRYSVGLITLTDAQKHAGNVTSKENNDLIDSGDAIKILRYSVGLITEF